MATTDARPIPLKNVALRITFPIYDINGDIVTAATGLDSEIDLDTVGFVDCTDEAHELGTSGIYYIDLTAAEMDADTVSLRVQTTSINAKTTIIVMYPQELNDIITTGTGANTVTLTVLDNNSDPVQGIPITIKNSGETLRIAGPASTNIDGEVIFNLDDGSYKALLTSTNIYEPLTSQALTVSGTTTDDYTLTPYSIGTPSSPTLCRVYGWITDANNQVVPSAQIVFKLDTLTTAETSSYLVSTELLVIKTNNEGYFYADLIRSSQYATATDYKVSCEKIGLKKTITVPDSATVNLNTLT